MISVRPSHILHITTGWHNGLNDLSATFTYIAGWHKGRNDLSATFTYIAHHCKVTQGSEWSQCYLRIHCASLQGNTMAWMISVLYTTHILHITAGWHNGLNDLSATFTYIAHHCRVTQWPEWSQCYLRIYCTSLQGDTVAWMIPALPSHISHITTGWHSGLKWSQYCLHIYCTSLQGDTMHIQTTQSAPSHPLRHPRAGVSPTHLCLLAD